MRSAGLLITGIFTLYATQLYSQAIKFEMNNLKPVGVKMSIDPNMGKEILIVKKNPEIKAIDQPTFVRVNGIEFKNGTIEVKVMSKLLPDAPELARGFIGVAFRINEDNSKFECIYLRPKNARAEDQLRRNHTLQYFSYPKYPYTRFRKESPGKYESYTDMALDEWIKVKIVIRDAHAQLFINNSAQPCLIVNDLKHGPDKTGAIGLWVDAGSEGFFSDLRVSE